MKRVIIFILALTLLFILSACGSTTVVEKEIEVPVIPEEYLQFQDLIDALKAEDYDTAQALLDGMKPKPAETVVSITPDNFWDYYEIVYPEFQLTKDASGKITEIWPTQTFSINLKEEYRIDYGRSNIEIGVTCDHKLHRIESVDWDTGRITVSEETYDDIAKKISSDNSICSLTTSTTSNGNSFFNIDFSYVVIYPCWSRGDWGGWSNAYNPKLGENKELYIFDIENFTIVRADGTLVIIN